MYLFLCKLWPYLAGALIGWLLSGWLARRLKHSEPPKEKIIEVEKEVIIEKPYDNPDLIKKLSLLEKENASISGLQAKLASFENAEPNIVEKTVTVEVEKQVDNPEHLKKIRALEESNQTLQAENKKLLSAQSGNDQTSTPTTHTAATNPAGISSTKTPDHENPAHLQRIKTLEDANKALREENSQIPELKSRIKQLENNHTSTARPQGLVSSSATSTSGSASHLDANRTTSGTAGSGASAEDIAAAKAAGFKLRKVAQGHDFTVVEGIGPKINELIHNAGIHTYSELSATTVDDIQKILDNAGPNFSLAVPNTWPAQSDMAARSQWDALRKWQDELDGGKE